MRVVLCNAPEALAPRLARALVDEGLVACVNILPGVRSIYRWQGEVCDEVEATMLIKVSQAGLGAMRTRLKELHPYQVPEIVVLTVDVDASLADYVAWVRGQAQPG